MFVSEFRVLNNIVPLSCDSSKRNEETGLCLKKVNKHLLFLSE